MRKILLVILVTLGFLVGQDFATLNIYSSKKANGKTDVKYFQLLLDQTKIVSFKNGERISIKILNPKNLHVKIRNKTSGYTYDIDFDFKNDFTYFWKFDELAQFSQKERNDAIDEMRKTDSFDSDSIQFLTIDVQTDKLVIQDSKNITISDVNFGTGNIESSVQEEIPARPLAVGAKEIDDFVNKAFDIYETTKVLSDQVRSINSKIQELMELQNIVGNPIKEVKKEAMTMERNVKILIKDSQELTKLAPDVLNSAKKLKFTKIASATKNTMAAADAIKWSIICLGDLLNNLPGILVEIGDFEKKNNIQDTEVVLDDVIEDSEETKSSMAVKEPMLKVKESEINKLNPAIGDMIFTTDTKKLLIFDGSGLKEIILKDFK